MSQSNSSTHVGGISFIQSYIKNNQPSHVWWDSSMHVPDFVNVMYYAWKWYMVMHFLWWVDKKQGNYVLKSPETGSLWMWMLKLRLNFKAISATLIGHFATSDFVRPFSVYPNHSEGAAIPKGWMSDAVCALWTHEWSYEKAVFHFENCIERCSSNKWLNIRTATADAAEFMDSERRSVSIALSHTASLGIDIGDTYWGKKAMGLN